MKDNVILYAHGSAYNHGCEAIVRSTVDLLSLKKDQTVLFSDNLEGDLSFRLDEIITIKAVHETPVNPSSVQGLAYRTRAHFANDHPRKYCFLSGKQQYGYLYGQGKTALSIGGDNYCYRSGIIPLAVRNYWLNKKGVKTILWGASLMEDFFSQDVVEDLNRYSLIVAREQVTCDLLKKYKVKAPYILAPDPAFLLKASPIDWPDAVGKKTIGINISPTVKISAKNKTIGLENYCSLLRWILHETDYEIALIPHVCFPNSENNDMRVQEELVKLVDYKGNRIHQISDSYNCCQLKHLISQCSLFVGTRTHATIAAYSTGVPTLVVGYSTKSIGIARDLFGTDSGFVIPVQAMESANELRDAFAKILMNRDQIKKQLTDRLPSYLETFNGCVSTMRDFLA